MAGKHYTADEMATRWFVLTIAGAALYITAAFLFVILR